MLQGAGHIAELDAADLLLDASPAALTHENGEDLAKLSA